MDTPIVRLVKTVYLLGHGRVTPKQISNFLGHDDLMISNLLLGNNYVRFDLLKSQHYMWQMLINIRESKTTERCGGLCLGDIVVSFFRIFAIPFHHLPVVILQQLLFVLLSAVLWISYMFLTVGYMCKDKYIVFHVTFHHLLVIPCSWTHAHTHTHVNCSQAGVWQSLVPSLAVQKTFCWMCRRSQQQKCKFQNRNLHNLKTLSRLEIVPVRKTWPATPIKSWGNHSRCIFKHIYTYNKSYEIQI